MIKLYVLYDEKQDKIISFINKSNGIIGAVNPATDGNHFENIIVSGVKEEAKNRMGLEKWWNWICEDKQNVYSISKEFSFEPSDVKIKCLEVS